MRLLFFVGLPRGPLDVVLPAVHPGAVVNAEQGGVQYVQSPYGSSIWRRVVRSIRDNMPASEAPSGRWSVWCVAAAGGKEQAKKTFRWLGRYRIAEPDRVLGPYDLQSFRQLAVSRTDDDGNALADMFPATRAPWVIFGDDPAEAMAEEYAPDDGEMQEE